MGVVELNGRRVEGVAAAPGEAARKNPREGGRMSLWNAYLDDITFSFRKQKDLAERAFRQVQSEKDFRRKPGEFSNSDAAVIKHVAGNLASRWTDFLTTDGDKPWRDRDAASAFTEADTRAHPREPW